MDFIQLVSETDLATAARMRFQAGRKEEIDMVLEGWQELERSLSDCPLREFVRERLRELAPEKNEPSPSRDDLSAQDVLSKPQPQEQEPFDYYVGVCLSASSTEDEKKKALRYLEVIQLTPRQICLLDATGNDALQHIALQHMETRELSEEDLLSMYFRVRVDGALEKAVERRILSLIQTFDGWQEVAGNYPQGTKVEILALCQMQKLAVTFEQKCRLFSASPSDSGWEQDGLQGMRKLAQTDEDWVEILELAPIETALYQEARKKIRELTLPFDEWLRVNYMINGPDRDLTEFIVLKLIETEPNLPSLA